MGAQETTFLEAARHAGRVLAWPEVGAAWGEPSALARMTVGAVAGHLFLVVRRVDKHLDEPEPGRADGQSTGTYSWLRVERDEDLDHDVHRIVRADGEHVAAWGWRDVVDAYVQRVERLDRRLAEHCPVAVCVPGGVIDFSFYLATRVVELLVHADDLAVSVDRSPPELPSAPSAIAIELLVDAARAAHGDLSVLRSLTRSERVGSRVPSVY